MRYIPTYEEFEEAVRKSAKSGYLESLTDDEINAYFEKEHAYIVSQYNEARNRYIAGETTITQFMVGTVGTTALNLELCYDC